MTDMYIYVPPPARICPSILPVRRHHDRRKQLVPLFSSLQLRPSKKPSQKCVALSKQGQRFLSSLATATAGGDISAANRLIKKFVAASPKSIALDALNHLLSPPLSQSKLSSLAFPLYLKIAESRWFDWNPKLVANVAASLDKQGQHSESTSLISDSISKLQLKERDLLQFYCNLVESHSKHNSIRGFDDSFRVLKELVCGSNSVYVKRQGFKSMVSGLCEIGRPREAEDLIDEMKMKGGGGVKPSMFEFRCVVYAYGRLGLIEEMQMSIEKLEKEEGFEIDTVCSNMVLASYGAQNALAPMVMWLQKMKHLGIPFSLRTCNSVLNSCPTIMSLVANSSFQYVPVSIQELIEILSSEEEEEAKLVEEIVGSCVLKEAMKWDELEGKLDLHGMHLSSAYVMMLIWIEEMRERLNSGNEKVPAEITVVCGSGNHSIVRGESPVKQMVKEIMAKTKSPMRIDRKNNGCFIAKGKNVKQWLS